jgi:hypothetical protein
MVHWYKVYGCCVSGLPLILWKSLVENEIGKRLKWLKSDNGGEYCSKDFDDYCSYHGIHREKTVLGTPQ